MRCGVPESDPVPAREWPAVAEAPGPRPREARPHYVSIQILRGLAASSVALFHASQIVGRPVHAAAMGVDIFFVISGFLMVSITDEDTRPWPFLKDRLLRIVPLYWLATGALLASLILVAPSGLPAVDHLLASLLFIPFRPTPEAPIFPVLTLGWTLNYEMMFYLIFGGTLLLHRKRRMLALTAIFVSLVVLGWAFRPASPALAFWSSPVIVQFLGGAWLAVWWNRGRARSVATGVVLIGCALLSLVGARIAVGLDLIPHLGIDRSPLVIPVMLLVAGALHLEPTGRSSLTRMLAALGNASYSIYIWQVSAILVAGVLASKTGMGPAATFTTIMASCIGGGLVSYHLLEKPLMSILRRPRSIRGIPVPAGP